MNPKLDRAAVHSLSHWMAVEWEESSKLLILSIFLWMRIKEPKKKTSFPSSAEGHTDSVWVSRGTQVIMFAVVIRNYTRTKQTDLKTQSNTEGLKWEEWRNHQPGANNWAFSVTCKMPQLHTVTSHPFSWTTPLFCDFRFEQKQGNVCLFLLCLCTNHCFPHLSCLHRVKL